VSGDKDNSYGETKRLLDEIHIARLQCPDDFDNLPDVDNSAHGRMAAKQVAVITADGVARRFLEGRGTWSHIAMDGLAQICLPMSDAERRERLIRFVAMHVAWIEAIDRRNVEKPPTQPQNGAIQPPPA